MSGKLAQAHALLADVAAEISGELSGSAAAEAVGEALPALGQLELVTCLLAERVERSGYFAADNAVSMAGWLRQEARSNEGWASARVQLGRVLVDRLPVTRKTWLSGGLTFEHADVIRWATREVSQQLAAALDETLSQAATRCTPKQLRDLAAELLERLAPELSEKRRARHEADVSAHLSDTLDGGRLDANLDAEGTAIVRAALEKYLPKPAPTVGADGAAGPPLPVSHRRARALVELARQSLDFGEDHPGKSNKPHLIVRMDEKELRAAVGAGQLFGGGTLPVGTVRRLACDAMVIPLVLGSDSLPLDIGRKSRVVPSWMRTALNERDGGCRAPGCDRPPAWTDVHHVKHWVDHGKTCLDNCCLLCRRHHTMVHQGKLRIRALGNQQFEFTTTNRRT